ncbi:LysR family transcriptional regulator [Variovorax terrae]|uniref:LysR substrate-binding domain-containing protein n=1 Tax=Variovorax terrae TaxID=2923278 RepID=A0A9X1VXX4_9BURK|nr:LysR substrate-binding domain-containing protein [Variovorax terrae]MCJ0765881.1 LysR substrate-binding domain-containing protein [Variovorax terrae]
MQLKWLEDFLALAQTRSFTRAAELRHVTHPAFGRRIRALEAWAGTPLVAERGGGPVALTPAGENFLENAAQLVQGLGSSREALRNAAGRQARSVSLATGRTLARTLVADWLVRLRPVLGGAEMQVLTRSLQETAHMLERGEVDFSLLYHHPVLAFGLNARQFTHLTLASDRLVPVSRTDARGRAQHAFGGRAPTPYLAYAPTLALGRLVDDHLANNPLAPALARRVECDSPDAHHEYALKGLGVAWLPWSMVHADCRAGRLAVLGDARLEVRFDVRLYRPKRRLGPLAESVWQAFVARG